MRVDRSLLRVMKKLQKLVPRKKTHVCEEILYPIVSKMEASYLRALHGLGPCLWRLNRLTESMSLFNLKQGFARVRCPKCRHELFVAFSCRGRCFCPSCHEKRALEKADWACPYRSF